MQRHPLSRGLLLTVLLVMLGACAVQRPTPVPVEPAPTLPADTWREIREDIWTASTRARSEAQDNARAAMLAWMERVRDRTESEFVPWYSGYWTQQWIGMKAGWYEMGREGDEAPVEDYLVTYLQEKFYELVLEPAGLDENPQSITEQAAAIYVHLLSEQLQRIPGTHGIALRSLQSEVERIPLIGLAGPPPRETSLFTLFGHNDLAGEPAYDALIAQANAVGDNGDASPDRERLQVVAQESVARLVAELPVRAGGSAAAMVIGQTVGLFISAGVAAWSAASHEREKPGIESRLRAALQAGLDDMWQILMEDPQLGVMSPVNHMSGQIEMGLFPAHATGPVVTF